MANSGATRMLISFIQLEVRTVDVGNPTFAMYSIRTLCGVLDGLQIKVDQGVLPSLKG
jgi:aspartyl aminopeptidase